MKREFTTEFLDENDIAHGGDAVVSDEQIDSLRWAGIREIVFRHEGKYWSVVYFQGLTEGQESGWGYGGDIEFVEAVEAVEVEPYEVAVTKYRPVAVE